MLTAVVGINWGDEGKGRMVDLLAGRYDLVVRYQGGNNAGHTVVNPQGKFILNLLPSGILRPETVNVMGQGMVIDLEHLFNEVRSLREKGIEISPRNLRISHRALICMPYHKLLDILEEDRLGAAQYGSTRRGIAPAYADKYMKKALRMEDLLSPDTLADKLRGVMQWKNLTIAGGYGAKPLDWKEMLSWLTQYGAPFKDHICDCSRYLDEAAEAGKSIMFEAQLGALRDIEYGIYPFTTSSSTIAAYATAGSGIPARRLDEVLGIAKAYSSCVGSGPFTCELFGAQGDALREAGAEYGAATGRPRRVGGFDCVATRYGVKVQGATALALTKLDVLAYMDKIPVCTAYEIDGEIVHDFPSGDPLLRAKPVYEFFEGFAQDISGCRSFLDLPEAARKYVEYIEQTVGCPIRYVSVGPGRDDYFER